MLDLIKTSYKLTINVSSYLPEYIQYPVDKTYNTSYLVNIFMKKLKATLIRQKLTGEIRTMEKTN